MKNKYIRHCEESNIVSMTRQSINNNTGLRLRRHCVPLIAMTILLSSCSLAPKFTEPKVDLPKSFKEEDLAKDHIVDDILWKKAEPLEAADRGQWWKIFGDMDLNALEDQALEANQSLKAASSRVEQSRQIANSVKGGLFPSIDLGGNAVRAKSSSASAAAFGAPATGSLKPYTLYSAEGVISYEADLFGRVRDSVKAARFDSDAQAAAYKSTMLALQADVATHYFTLRSLDSERKLLKDTVKIRQEANRIMGKRFKEGVSGEQDISRTRSELASAQADLVALDRNRSKIEHALAVLLGKLPSEFTFGESPLANNLPPQIPAGIPSALLQRRPDINAALINMQAANARIGVAKAAFFPSLTLSASGGFSSTSAGHLFNTSAQSWALGQVAGNALKLPIFHGGTNKANLEQAKNAYDESVANYRQQVLVAFRDVEDSLVDQALLGTQSIKQDEAAKAASRTTSISKRRYSEGETSYFEVVDAERVSLGLERAAVQIRGQRFMTTIALIRALGGGWE